MIDFDLTKIRGMAFDVDGVLSRQTITLASSGEPLRTVNIRDGYALQLAAKMGLSLAIITGGSTNAVRLRYERLGVSHIYQGAQVKTECLRRWLAETGVEASQVAFMGDDVPDVPVLKMVGLPLCPADAAPDAVAVCRYVSHLRGGEGCVRDVVEQVLRAQGKWMADERAFGW